MTNIQNKLVKIGLTKNQALIYLELFKLSESKAGKIISRTGLHRHIVYSSLEELERKGLTSSYTSRGIKHYKALSATHLMNRIQEQEIVTKEVIEELAVLNTGHTNAQEIIVHEGIDGFRDYVINTFAQLDKNSTVRYMGISADWFKIVGNDVLEEMRKIQKRNNIKIKALVKELSFRDKEYIDEMEGLVEARVSPLFSSDTSSTEIIDGKVFIRSFIAPYFVVEISHTELARNYKDHFDFLWDQSK